MFYHFGRYLLLLKSLFTKPEKASIYWKAIISEMNSMGVGSLGIVALVALFMGAVTTVQTAYQLTNPFIPVSIIGSIVSDSSILALGPTLTCLVLSGKIGSSIASQIGTMRVSEQIDALEIMGINSAGYLILPKLIAAVIVIPLLIIIAIFLSTYGGMMVGAWSGYLSTEDFMMGAMNSFRPFTVVFAMIKTVCFAFIIASVSAYFGYYTQGGSLEVGKASTKAVVYSCILVLVSDYLLAELILK
ncbi:MAG: ABC transporter permease [Bacteroidetes bacterium]|nr:MAG: ABC transporter permease [Bacteroidota bacterium]